MTSKKYINILKDIRQQLIQYTNNKRTQFKSLHPNYSLTLTDNFKIIELEDQLDMYDSCSIHGVTYIDATHWISIKPGIKMADPKTLIIRFMAVKFKDKEKYLPIEAVIHTFIHELTHTITIPEAHTSKHIDKMTKKIQPTVSDKKKRSFMQNHHTTTFYVNFARLLRICEELDIYIMPKNYRLFTPKNLQRYDSMINHNDLFSLGASPKYGI